MPSHNPLRELKIMGSMRYTADALITDEQRVISQAFIDVDDAGMIRALGALQDAPALPPGEAKVTALGRVVLAPGQLNAHSHAFQRALRARTEHLRHAQDADDFWSWRALMYELANTHTPESMYQVALKTYREMAATGITGVGEFHYVHHQPDGRPYEDREVMAHAVIQAARDAGLRITLLRVAYQRAGAGKPALEHQRRFIDADIEQVLSSVEAIAQRWRHDPLVHVGVAPHSVRAVDRAWLEACARYGAASGRPVHIHVCEQRAEITQCIAEHGLTPIELLEDCGLLALGQQLTLVHATHLSPRELTLLEQRRPNICACPSTERNLGDGFLPALQLLERRLPLCVGSDSHANIDPWDELRLIEYHERLRYEQRNVLARALPVWHPERQGPQHTSALLWPMGTRHGAQALGMAAGELGVGKPADMVALDLDHFSLQDIEHASLIDALVFGVKPGAVAGVWSCGSALSGLHLGKPNKS